VSRLEGRETGKRGRGVEVPLLAFKIADSCEMTAEEKK
jgi:hypothetical protein